MDKIMYRHTMKSEHAEDYNVSTMTMICPCCDSTVSMRKGIFMCGCGFAPKHGAD